MTTTGDPPEGIEGIETALSAQATDDDWPSQASDSIVDLVGTVRDKTTGPALKASRGLVYGLLLVVLATILFVLVTIAAIRALEVWLPVGGIWLPYLIVGSVFVVVGLGFWRYGARAEEPAELAARASGRSTSRRVKRN